MHTARRALTAVSGALALPLALTAGTTAWAAEGSPPSATAAPTAPSLAPIRVDRTVSVPVEGGCQYTATFIGVVTPTRAPPATAEPVTGPVVRQAWLPDVRVDAVLSCPAGTTVRSSELSATAPLPLHEIAHALALRGALTGAHAGRACSYVPSFELDARGMLHAGVDYECGAAGAAIGGGPSLGTCEQPRIEPPSASEAPPAEVPTPATP